MSGKLPLLPTNPNRLEALAESLGVRLDKLMATAPQRLRTVHKSVSATLVGAGCRAWRVDPSGAGAASGRRIIVRVTGKIFARHGGLWLDRDRLGGGAEPVTTANDPFAAALGRDEMIVYPIGHGSDAANAAYTFDGCVWTFADRDQTIALSLETPGASTIYGCVAVTSFMLD